jgi:two-component system cell cycle sensor histidine kinase/response regulator CckA
VQAQHDLGEVLGAAARASDLTQQLLAFGRRQTLVASVTSLNEVVSRTERMLARVIDERIEIACGMDDDLYLVRADAGQIEQVIVNLALNARDAMPNGGTLTIETSNVAVVEEHGPVPPGDYATVSVRDTGDGFDDDVRERLFEPFFTTKEVGKGTGLGLAVVFGIVEQSRGHILVESEPGAGSCFQVLLPRTYDAVPVAPPAVAPPDLAPGTETILLVEDEEVVRRLTTTMLEASGYRVIAAATPAEALAVDSAYDLLLTDVVMPGLAGPDLWERLGRPAVLFTSGYSAAVVGDGQALPGDLMEKPFSADELARRVRAALDGQPKARPQAHSLG